MRDPLQNWMRVGILQPAAFPRASTLVGLRRITGDPFFQADETTSTGSDATRQEAADVLRAAGLEVDFDAGSLLYAHGASLCSLDPSIRSAAVDKCFLIGPTRAPVNEALTLAIKTVEQTSERRARLMQNGEATST